jgi:hypothetical protein
MGKKLGSGMNNPDHISESFSFETIFVLKYLNSLMQFLDGKIWIRDGKNWDPGSKNWDPS